MLVRGFAGRLAKKYGSSKPRKPPAHSNRDYNTIATLGCCCFLTSREPSSCWGPRLPGGARRCECAGGGRNVSGHVQPRNYLKSELAGTRRRLGHRGDENTYFCDGEAKYPLRACTFKLRSLVRRSI